MKKLWIRSIRFLASTALLTSPIISHAVDVEFMGVIKLQSFRQNNPTAPALVEDWEDEGDPPFLFNVFVDLVSSNAVTNATVTRPGGAVRALALEDDGYVRDFSDGTEFKADLDLAYANGAYTLFLQTRNDGNKTISLTLPAGDAYPNPPRVSNLAAAQALNATANFTLTWDTFAGGTDTDFVMLEIEDSVTDAFVFETAGPGEPGSLDGTSTSVVIPAGTLSPGRNYRAILLFAKIVDFDDTSYGSGVPGVAAFVVETEFRVRTTGGTDIESPQLFSSMPFNSQLGVKGSAVMAFTFSERMNTALSLGSSIAWANLNPGLVTYTWSTNGRTLFCVYPPGLPANSLIEWQLNPPASPQNLRDVAGNPLASQAGWFTTGGESGAGEKDVEFLALVKGRLFRQAGSVAQSLEQYEFSMTSDLRTLNGVTNGLVTLPNARAVMPELDFGDAFDFEARYSSAAQVNLFFPDGSYQVRLNTVHDGTRDFGFNLSGSTYPNAPQIANYAAAQTVNPTNAFVLAWGEFVGGTINDFIAVEIEDEDDFLNTSAFETPNVGEPGALNGTQTSVMIPAFTFAPGRRYIGQLIFVKVSQVDATTYPGAVGASGYFSVTTFELQTTGDLIRPSVQISNLGNNLMRILVTGEKNRLYTIESTDELYPLGGGAFWQPRFSGNASEHASGFIGSFEWQDGMLSFMGSRFYRVREGANFGGGP